jgi:signal transduction histidine kinase
LWERTWDWLRVTHLNFKRIYPWLLFAPYVVWLTSRFYLERERFVLNLAVQLAGCAIFAIGTNAINSRLSRTTARILVIQNETDIRPANGLAQEKKMVHVAISGAGTAPFPDEREIVSTWHTQLVMAGTAATGAFPTSVAGGPHPEALKFMPTNVAARLEEAIKPAFSRAGSSARPLAVFMDMLAYGALVGMAHAVHFYRRYRERERRALCLESNLTKARLHALQAQLQPHFLFNTLNAIVTLLRRDPRAAENTLMSLSDLLRLALSRSQEQEIPLRDELLFLERYIQIQQTRFGERLAFETNVEGTALDCLVPTLMLQPLVENAVQHGIEPAGSAGMVRVLGRREEGRLIIEVADNGAGLGANESANGGIGLSNLRQRLSGLYGADHTLDISSPPEGGTNVRIALPWHKTASLNDGGANGE